MATLVDTSVLVAALHTSDSLHEKAITALAEVEKPLLIHEYVALETATVLMIRAGKPKADAFLASVLAYEDFELLYSSETLFSATATAFMAKNHKLSFADSALVSLSGTYEVLTFDKALIRALKA